MDGNLQKKMYVKVKSLQETQLLLIFFLTTSLFTCIPFFTIKVFFVLFYIYKSLFNTTHYIGISKGEFSLECLTTATYDVCINMAVFRAQVKKEKLRINHLPSIGAVQPLTSTIINYI